MKRFLKFLAACALMIPACTASGHPTCSCVPSDAAESGGGSSGSSGALDETSGSAAPCSSEGSEG